MNKFRQKCKSSHSQWIITKVYCWSSSLPILASLYKNLWIMLIVDWEAADGEMQPHIIQIWTLYFRTKILCFHLLLVKSQWWRIWFSESKKVLRVNWLTQTKYKINLWTMIERCKLPRLWTWSFHVIYVLY